MEVARDVSEVLNMLKDLYVNKRKDVGVSLLAKCLRSVWFRMQTGQDIVTDVMLHGTERHHWMERHFPQELEKRGYRCMPEVKVTYGDIAGYVDLMCEKDGMRYVFEFKFTSNPSEANPFMPQYRKQLEYYAAMADAVGVLVLSDFNVERSYTEVVVLSDEDRERVLDELKRRYDAIKSGREPPAEYGPWCKFCSFKNKCMNKTLV
jgi:CRISPR/Cas system-associated exonuclease Cas4 (RecB family)